MQAKSCEVSQSRNVGLSVSNVGQPACLRCNSQNMQDRILEFLEIRCPSDVSCLKAAGAGMWVSE